MQVVLIGAVHRRGIAKGSGNPYDFAVLMVLRPVSTRGNEKMKVTGYGYEQAEIRTSLDVVERVGKLSGSFPVRALLTISNEMGEFGQLQAVATEVQLDKPAQSAAPRAA